jgi:hypothetical protein
MKTLAYIAVTILATILSVFAILIIVEVTTLKEARF